MDERGSAEKARYDFKKAMQEILDLKGRGTELISVYIPPAKHIFDVMAYLRNEYSQSSNIKSKSTMKNVQSAIDSIMARLKTYKNTPPRGLVIFCGEVARAGDQTRMVQHVLEPPETVATFFYRCDSQFYTEPLLVMLQDKKTYGLITMDRSEATLGLLTGSKVVVIKNFDSMVPRKHRQGGQSAQRFERLIELAAHEFFKKISDNATEVFLNREEMMGILIGGPGATKDYFVKEGYLHHELQKKVVDTFDTGYTDEYGLRELVENAKSAIVDIELMHEKELIQRLLTEIRNSDGGLSAYGEEIVRDATMAGAADVILLSEDLNKRRVYVKCPNGHNYAFTSSSEQDGKIACRECGSSAEIERDIDLVDDFFEIADQFSSSVEIISADSEEGEMLMKAFGGIAAVLRYRV
ncbi:MAG: peptide chain release factor aRF-1 [Methanomassiliicoccaceae archaeon]|jgi:peptide chain release factor subunit 1|nr:peptide chain release factor aRF-1 [Methanomassiliicoccaceae archaeon]